MIYSFLRWIVRGFFRIAFRVRAEGTEREPPEGPVVLCCNHLSVLDPPLIACFLRRRLRYMAKAELFEIPGFAALIRHFGAFPVHRGGMTMETMRTAVGLLKDGHMIVVFPQGSRRKPGELGEGKRGAASLALRGGAKIFPVAIIGDYRPFRPMKVVFGEPFDAAEAVAGVPPAEQASVLTAAIMRAIGSLIERHS